MLAAFRRFDPATGGANKGRLAIGPTEIHLWAYTISDSDAVIAAWFPLLSADEVQRANRFVHRENRGRWIVAHGVLRRLLAEYVGVDPKVLRFEHGAAGKPSVAIAGGSNPPVTFNLAHSHGRALLGVASCGEIGVDLELIRDDFDPLPLARQYFFGSELEAILRAPAEHQRDAFFRHWVAKEAVLKAQGIGLSLPLSSFAVTFESEGTVARVQTYDPAQLAPDWFVRTLSWDAGWRGAVSALGDHWELRLRT